MGIAIIDELIARSHQASYPDGQPFTAITHGELADLAQKSGISGRELEILALENDILPLRYARNRKSFEFAEQAALLKSRVGVIGLGGLGGVVVELLARVGIGFLKLVDGDVFEEHNLNRQLFSAADNLGASKAKAAAREVARIDPFIQVSAHTVFLNQDNGVELLSGLDLAVDCLDTLTARRILEASARQVKIPLVSAAVAGASGQLTTIFPGDPGFALVHGPAEDVPAKGAETVLGCLPYAVFFLASLECAEAVKVLLGQDDLLRNRLLAVDLSDHTHAVFDLQ